jgi:hypothetical protein
MSKRYYTKVIGGHSLPKAPTSIEERPRYIIKVSRSWRYGPRARFWDIQEWKEAAWADEGGYWKNACRGGLAYTNWGMWMAINRRLKKMKFGYIDEYYNLNKDKINLN